MKNRRKWILFFALGLTVLIQLACGANILISDLDKFNCTSKGGIWRQEVDANHEVQEWCEMPTGPTATATTFTILDCYVPLNGYNWSLEDHKSSSGTGGLACNARFLFTNTSSQPELLIVYTSWDNNAMKSSGWESHPVPAGGTWEKRVNRTLYKDGAYTFDRIEKLLVILDTPECTAQIPSQNLSEEWEAKAEILDEIPCP